MTRISHEIQIDAAKDDVWAAIADLGAIQDFHPGVKKSYYTTEQESGVGASRHCDLKPFGSVEERATEWKEGESLALEIYDGEKTPPFKSAIAHISVEENADGTIARFALEYELKFGLLGRLMDRFMVKRQFDKVVPAILSGLKRHMERGARSNGNGKPIRKELNHG